LSVRFIGGKSQRDALHAVTRYKMSVMRQIGLGTVIAHRFRHIEFQPALDMRPNGDAGKMVLDGSEPALLQAAVTGRR
jgi:hypothetical protein